MTDMQVFKHKLSVLLIDYYARINGMTYEEYSKVYDSEAHERRLNDFLQLIKQDGVVDND